LKKAIVTGANGFVGSAVVEELSRRNIQTIAVVRNENSNIEKIRKLPYVTICYCNLSNIETLSSKIPDRDIEAFYHFAWEGSAGKLRADCDVQLDNVKASIDALKVCHELGCSRFVFASSIMEYEVAKLMNTELSPSINTLYCTAKITADYMCKAIASQLDVEYISGIISNIYGVGEISPRLINTSVRKLLLGERPIFSSGIQQYDFIYITDAAKAFLAIGEKGKKNKSYYIGSSRPHSLKEYLIEMRDVVSPGAEIGLGELTFNGVSLTYTEFDIHALENDTGFKPEVSFADGINRTAIWIKKTI